MSEGVEAGPLARLLLKRIDLNDNGISMDRGGHHPSVEEKEPSEIATLDGRYAELDHADEGCR